MSGIGFSQMSALMSSQNLLTNVTDANRNRTKLKGEMGVLASEIEDDKNRGLSTKDKEARFAKAEEGADSMMSQISETAAKIRDKIAEDNEKVQEEEKAKAEAAKKAAKDDKADDRVKTGGDGIISRSAASEDGDTVEISERARAASANAPETVTSEPIPQSAAPGESINTWG